MSEKYGITAEEKEKVLDNYFKGDFNNLIEVFPSKEKKKIIILEHIVTRFEKDKTYSETELNEILKGIYHDYASVRRYLIEYRFFDRSKDGSLYWIKDEMEESK